MARQPTYKQLFRVGDAVEVAHAPLDGETQPHWINGRVVKISSSLHVQHTGWKFVMAYSRAMYNRGEIRRARIHEDK